MAEAFRPMMFDWMTVSRASLPKTWMSASSLPEMTLPGPTVLPGALLM